MGVSGWIKGTGSGWNLSPSTIPQAFYAIRARTGQLSFHSVKELRDTLGDSHHRPDYFGFSSGSSPLHGC